MKNTGKLAKTKKIFLRLIIITFLVLIFWWLYGIYAKIEVSGKFKIYSRKNRPNSKRSGGKE